MVVNTGFLLSAESFFSYCACAPIANAAKSAKNSSFFIYKLGLIIISAKLVQVEGKTKFI
jgi:hypothetical protein